MQQQDEGNGGTRQQELAEGSSVSKGAGAEQTAGATASPVVAVGVAAGDGGRASGKGPQDTVAAAVVVAAVDGGGDTAALTKVSCGGDLVGSCGSAQGGGQEGHEGAVGDVEMQEGNWSGGLDAGGCESIVVEDSGDEVEGAQPNAAAVAGELTAVAGGVTAVAAAHTCLDAKLHIASAAAKPSGAATAEPTGGPLQIGVEPIAVARAGGIAAAAGGGCGGVERPPAAAAGLGGERAAAAAGGGAPGTSKGPVKKLVSRKAALGAAALAAAAGRGPALNPPCSPVPISSGTDGFMSCAESDSKHNAGGDRGGGGSGEVGGESTGVCDGGTGVTSAAVGVLQRIKDVAAGALQGLKAVVAAAPKQHRSQQRRRPNMKVVMTAAAMGVVGGLSPGAKGGAAGGGREEGRAGSADVDVHMQQQGAEQEGMVQVQRQGGKAKRKAADGAVAEHAAGVDEGSREAGRGKAARGDKSSPGTVARAGRSARHSKKSVDVLCGGMLGVFDYRYFPACKVRLDDGREVSLSQFEVLGVKGKGKTWKNTVQVVEGGKMKEALGKWLGDRGLSGAKS